MIIEFEIPNNTINHLKEKSSYTDNYYKIDLLRLGVTNKIYYIELKNYQYVITINFLKIKELKEDIVFYYDAPSCNIIHEIYNNINNIYDISFGFFNKDVYVPMMSFDSPYGIDELKEKGNWYEN